MVLHQELQLESRLALESSLIQVYRSNLNAPWVGVMLSKLRLHEKKFPIFGAKVGKRFICRANRHARYRHVAVASQQHTIADPTAVCLSLYRLGSNTCQKFEESKLLRSNKVSLAALYLRVRFLKFIDEPWRGRAQRQLQSVLRFRKGDLPPQNVPLILQPAAHDLRAEVKVLIRSLLRYQKYNFPPLHLPSDKLVLRRGKQLTQLVFNYRAFMRTWTRNTMVQCKCRMYQPTTQASSTVEGHVMCPAGDIVPTSCLAKANLADTTFLQEHTWKSQVLAALTNWCKRWKQPSDVIKHMSNWVDRQWSLHVTALQQDTQHRWNPRQIKEATRSFAGLVLGPADHFPHSLFATCPVHYHKLICRSFGDPTVFMPRRNGTGTIIQHLQREFEDKHPELQCYKWAFQWNRGLPNARILPKGSKNFAKARPIIAYTKCWHTKASSFLATALYSIMQILFPAGTTLNISSVTTGLRQAWRYMQQFEQDDPVMIQQDLIGFFNSVPHSRICTALQLVLYQLQEHFGQDLDSLTFQVDHKAGTKDLRIFRGHRRFRGSTTKVLHIKHVMQLTKFLLQSAYFKMGMDTFCQIQGACMGSPLAPVLCAMVAAEQEFLTIRSLRTQLDDAGLLRSFRYADNRCFFLRRAECHTDWACLFLRLDFYGLPIELELVPGEELLGSTTSVTQGTITMRQPINETVLRSTRSAGDRSAALSGFQARALSIKRHARPIRLIRPQVEDLIEIYRRRGFGLQELFKLASKFRA